MKKDKEYFCPVELTIEVIGGKWKPLIIYRIGESTVRFNQLRKLIPRISQKVLAAQLHELEEDGIIERKEDESVPARIGYCLTDLGKTVLPMKSAMCAWGSRYGQLKHIKVRLSSPPESPAQ